MSKLIWGNLPPEYDRGVEQGVLYLDGTAKAWNGLISVEERDTGSIDEDHYFDGNRMHISQQTGDFEGTITAYTYPEAFAEYNGFSDRDIYKRFGLAYRTEFGEGHKLHLVYNVMVRDDDRSWKTLDAGVDPSIFSWNIYGTAVPIPGSSPSSRIILETPIDDEAFSDLEDILYGTETTEPRLPDPAEIIELYESATLLRITYNGDGTYTATGPDDMVRLLSDGRFEIDSPSAFELDPGIFVVHSQ